MARSDNPLQNEGIQVVAHGGGGTYSGSPTNSALQLAGALQDAEPTIRDTLGAIVDKDREDETLKAKKDALLANGAKLADAVRDGTLQPTQNPFYVKAYATEGAALRTKSALSNLQLQSASWQEQADPSAFQKRWGEEVGKIGQDYTAPDEIAGFTPVANQYTQQVVQANVSEAARKMEADRKAGIGALGADTIQTALRANGGVLSPSQLSDALAPVRDQWHQTGGTQGDFDLMAIQAVTTAASASNHPELLDTLKGLPNSSGHGSLYDLPGQSQKIEQDKFYIGKQAEGAIEARVGAITALQKEGGMKGVAELDAKYGDSILTSPPSANDIVAFLGNRYTPAEKAEAVKVIQQRATPYASLDKTRYEIAGNNPSSPVYSLSVEASTKGYSQDLEDRISKAMWAGQMSPEDASKMVAHAVSTGRSNVAEGRAAASFSKTMTNYNADVGGIVHNRTTLLGAASDLAAGVAAQYQTKTGKPMDAKTRAGVTRLIKDSAGAVLASKPGAWDEANRAAQTTSAAILKNMVPKKRSTAAPAGSGNNRG